MMEAEPPNNQLVLKKLEQMESVDRNVRFLNTRRTQFRSDDHPLSHCEPGTLADGRLHWCPPGVPKTRYKLLYSHQLLKDSEAI